MSRPIDNDRLYENPEYFATLVNTTSTLVFGIDKDGYIVSFNRACEELSGYTKHEAIGKKVWNFLTPDEDRFEIEGRFKVIRPATFPARYESQWVCKNGSIKTILWQTGCTTSTDGSIDLIISTGIDMTEQRNIEKEQKLLLDKLQTTIDEMVYERTFRQRTLETSGAITVIFEAGGTIVDFNPAAEQVSGYSRNELIGKSLSALLPQSVSYNMAVWYETVKQQGIRKNDIRPWITKDGQVRQILWNTSTFEDERDGRKYIITAGIDITEIQNARKELTDANQVLQDLTEHLEQRVADRTKELQATIKELESFSYSMSHDLRAPLRHILSFIDLITIKEFSIEPELQKYLTIIRDAALRMSQLIEGLLVLLQIGRSNLALNPVDLNTLTGDVMIELRHECKNRSIEWKIGKLPIIRADRNMMFLIFQNLISNAIKFTKAKNPAIIEIYATQDDHSAIVHVKDNGVGFDMQYVDKLFGVFQRLHQPEEFEGTGIGLANVQRMVERHGGKI